MLTSELSLFAFTLLGQLAAGAVLLATLLPLKLRGAENQPEVDLLSRRLLWVAAPAAVLAILFSLFHLGTPLGAYRALLNLSTSWLSREVLLTGIFGGLTVVTAFTTRKGRANGPLLWASAAFGLIAVYAMGRLYQSFIMPAWATTFTPISFFTATVMLGVVAAAILLLLAWGQGAIKAESAGPLLQSLAVAGGVALGLQLAAMPFFVGALSHGPEAAQTALSLLTGGYAALLAVRSAAGILGVALLGRAWFMLSQSGYKQSTGMVLAYLAVVGIASGEVLARLLFYALGVPIQVG